MSNFIYKLSEDSDFLMHHGIKGQKWGEQNGPPYPLNKKEYSALEKRMAGIQKQSDITNKKSSNIKETYRKSFGKRGSTELLNNKLVSQSKIDDKFYKNVQNTRVYITKLKNSRLYSNNEDAQKIFKQYENSIDDIIKNTSLLPESFYNQGQSRNRDVNTSTYLFGMAGFAAASTRTNKELTRLFNDPKLMAEWNEYLNS